MKRKKLILLTMLWGFGYLMLGFFEVFAVRHGISSWLLASLDTVYLIGGAGWLAWHGDP